MKDSRPSGSSLLMATALLLVSGALALTACGNKSTTAHGAVEPTGTSSDSDVQS